jgi:AraC-like DNA-binding protein
LYVLTIMPLPQMISAMPTLVARLASHHPEGETQTGLRSVHILKVVTPGELAPEIQKPVVSLILQGEKRLLIGSEVLRYRRGDTYVSAVDLPTRIDIMGCSRKNPYLAVSLRPDPAMLADLLKPSEAPVTARAPRAFAVHTADENLLDAYRRLLHIIDRPGDLDVLGPLIEREILFRLLQGPPGPVLRTIAVGNGQHDDSIARAIRLIRKRYTEPIRAEDLADAARMSLPTFYRHFKAETGMSPLQYRTRLRLYEARSRLLLSKGPIADLAFSLGYENASQFSREYAREFGGPPAKDRERLRMTAAPHKRGWAR